MKTEILNKLKSQNFKVVGFICGGIFLLLLTFTAGVEVGLHKARFSYAFGENYEKNFGGSKDGQRGDERNKGNDKRGMMKRGMLGGEEFRNGHGVAGEIISISGDSVVIKGKDNQESTARITETTIINRGQDTIQLSELKVGDKLVVVGKPGEDGVIGSHLVRVLPVDMVTPTN